MPYSPGLHLLAEFRTDNTSLFVQSGDFKPFIEKTIAELGLVKVGETYHDFPGGGFTAVVCLTESHLSIHTWPEYGSATFDVFLSNYQKNNDAAAYTIFEAVKKFFEATAHHVNEIRR